MRLNDVATIAALIFVCINWISNQTLAISFGLFPTRIITSRQFRSKLHETYSREWKHTQTNKKTENRNTLQWKRNDGKPNETKMSMTDRLATNGNLNSKNGHKFACFFVCFGVWIFSMLSHINMKKQNWNGNQLKIWKRLFPMWHLMSVVFCFFFQFVVVVMIFYLHSNLEIAGHPSVMWNSSPMYRLLSDPSNKWSIPMLVPFEYLCSVRGKEREREGWRERK